MMKRKYPKPNIEVLKQQAETTMKSLKARKKVGLKRKEVSIDGLIMYCENVLALCEEIDELNDFGDYQ